MTANQKTQGKRRPVTEAQRTILGFAHSEIKYVKNGLRGKINQDQDDLLRQAMEAIELFHACTQ